MAADWIKMRMGLRTHPKIVRMSSALTADRFRVIGALHAVWCLADEHTRDGKLPGYTLSALDDSIGWPGFSQAMSEVDWLKVDSQGLVLPRFFEHNGASAKRRAMEAERKRRDRKTSAGEADKKRTRERERSKEQAEPKKNGSLDPVWGYGLETLTSAGIPEGGARSFIGSLLASWSSDDVLEALTAANGKADPRGYARAVLKTKPKRGAAAPFPA